TCELTRSGATPAGAVSLSAFPVPLLVSASAAPEPVAVRLVARSAVFDWPRTKLPPVAAHAVPANATNKASNATSIARDTETPTPPTRPLGRHVADFTKPELPAGKRKERTRAPRAGADRVPKRRLSQRDRTQRDGETRLVSARPETRLPNSADARPPEPRKPG